MLFSLLHRVLVVFGVAKLTTASNVWHWPHESGHCTIDVILLLSTAQRTNFPLSSPRPGATAANLILSACSCCTKVVWSAEHDCSSGKGEQLSSGSSHSPVLARSSSLGTPIGHALSCVMPSKMALTIAVAQTLYVKGLTRLLVTGPRLCSVSQAVVSHRSRCRGDILCTLYNASRWKS